MAGSLTRSAIPAMTFAVVSCLLAVVDIAAQESGEGQGDLDVSRRTGPPGTLVTVDAAGLAPTGSYRIAIGALRFGFEELGWVMANDDGELSIEVEIPEWGRNDVVHRFILNDLYQKPVGFSGSFHVTNAEGDVRREGTIAKITGHGLGLIGVDGITYALEGDLEGFDVGSELFVEGPVVESCGCGEMVTILVRRANLIESLLLQSSIM